MNIRGASGFTFFEILLVVAIGLGISATGIVGLSKLQAIFKLRGVGDEIRGQVQLARELAIANKGSVIYAVKLASGIITLVGGTQELARFQSPPGVTFLPDQFVWSFAPITGKISGCTPPCELTLSSSGDSEIVTIQSNGITN